MRPLIFPRAIVDHCRTLWPTNRAHRYSFAGLLTDSRRTLLDALDRGRRRRRRRPLAARTSLGGFVRRH